MKQLLRYFVEELRMPPETLKLMVEGMIRGIQVEQLYDANKETPPEGPA